MLDGADGEEDNWDFEVRMTAKEEATPGTLGKLQDLQRVCEDAG